MVGVRPCILVHGMRGRFACGYCQCWPHVDGCHRSVVASMSTSNGKGLVMETETVEQVGFTATRVCVECDRAFNLFDADDANEWFHGHDCEAA